MSGTSIPEELIRSLHGVPGFDEKRFLAAHAQEPLTSVRLNPKKPSGAFASAEKVPWCDEGRYLEKRPSFTNDPLFHAGCYYVQEASSMFIGYLLKACADLSQPLRILDLCAAPGGKSTHIASLLPSGGLLVSNEVIRSRVNILSDNLTRWGNANVVVSNNDPSHFQRLEGFFDVIVVDAPCSGSGLLRKQDDAAEEWSTENVNLCSQRQQRILADVLPALKQDGLLIYSTCSYSPKENEEICDKLVEELGMDPITVHVEKSWGITETRSARQQAQGFRFYPYQAKGEGFFAACFSKKKDAGRREKKAGRMKRVSAKEEEILRQWLIAPEQLLLFRHEDQVHAFPGDLEKELAQLQEHLFIRKAGTLIGKMVNNELIPDHELAVSIWISGNVPRLQADLETALRYLRKEEIRPGAAAKGWALVCFEQQALGWAKVLPNRVNNYYPKELRILMKQAGT